MSTPVFVAHIDGYRARFKVICWVHAENYGVVRAIVSPTDRCAATTVAAGAAVAQVSADTSYRCSAASSGCWRWSDGAPLPDRLVEGVRLVVVTG